MRTINYVLRGTATEIRADFAADAGGGVSVPALSVLVVRCPYRGRVLLPLLFDEMDRLAGSGPERVEVEVEITIRPAWPAVTPLMAHEFAREPARAGPFSLPSFTAAAAAILGADTLAADDDDRTVYPPERF